MRGPSPFPTPKAQYRGDGFVPVERPAPRRAAMELPVSIDPDEIAGELALPLHATVDTLAALRRRFAMQNHPDRASLEQRGRATRRMAIANGMIDKAMDDRLRRARA